MARNSEKAVTALARWRQLQLKEQGKLIIERRPNMASDERDLKRAEKWRNQVIREIAKKVTQIQNAGLGEFKIRDLNDEINKLLREKDQWETRIKELHGPDYKKVGPKLLDKEGREVPGSRGYKYFGAAKDLPGVKELFEQEVISGMKKSKAELLREIDAEYYGYLDDDDNLLIPQEEKCEKEARQRKIYEFKKKAENECMEVVEPQAPVELFQDLNEIDSEDEEKAFYEKYLVEKSSMKSKKVLDVPSLKDVEEAILEKKKKELLSKYVSDEMIQSEAEARLLAGKI